MAKGRRRKSNGVVREPLCIADKSKNAPITSLQSGLPNCHEPGRCFGYTLRGY
jgi:hypothetical protein